MKIRYDKKLSRALLLKWWCCKD